MQSSGINAESQSVLFSFLDDVRNPLRDETTEERIRKGSNVRFVLGSGLQIKSVLMPGEKRQLAIFCSQRDSCRMDEICEVLRAYGEIESCTTSNQGPKTYTPSNSTAFGYVTFKDAKGAEAAVRGQSSILDFRVEFALKEAATSRSRSANFSVKVEVCRRPLKGIGYVQFQSCMTAYDVLSSIVSFEVQKKVGQGRMLSATIIMSQNRKNNDQTVLKDVPCWATSDIVKRALQVVLRHMRMQQDVLNVVLIRNPPPVPIEDQRRFLQFRGLITHTLLDSGAMAAHDFDVNMNEPKEKDFNMFAVLRFEDPDKAAEAAGRLDGLPFGDVEIEARLDLKTTFIVSAFVYGSCKQDVLDEVERLNESTAGVIKVEMKRRENGSYLIQVDASELEDLKEARTRLDEIIYGHRLDLTSGKFMQLKTDDWKKRKEDIQRKARVRIRPDDRQEAVFIYGKRAAVTYAKLLIDDYLNKNKISISKDISLREDGYPRGIMKALVCEYGSNLERLKVKCRASSLELILRRHVVRFQGTSESYEELKRHIEEKAGEIPGLRLQPDPSPECCICLCSVDYDDCYVLEYCGHFYCNDCARDLVRNGLTSYTIPIKCVVEECGKNLVLRDFQNLLPNMEEAFDPAIRSFIASCDKEYAYCTTPDCPMIYRKSKKTGEEFTCSECNVSLCTKCDASYHRGMTCEIFGNFFVKADNELKVWLLGDTEKRALCTKCGIGIEKIDGCNHVECKACKGHICWKCKKLFPNSDSCYQHMRSKHGGYYDQNIENFE